MTSTHQPLLTRTAAAAAASPTRRRRMPPGAATAYVIANAGRTRYACRYFVLNASPTSTAAATTQRVRPASSPRRNAHAASTRSSVRSASGLL